MNMKSAIFLTSAVIGLALATSLVVGGLDLSKVRAKLQVKIEVLETEAGKLEETAIQHQTNCGLERRNPVTCLNEGQAILRRAEDLRGFKKFLSELLTDLGNF